jgi:hypothetical protein
METTTDKISTEEKISPVVFKPFYDIPECEKPRPDEILSFKHFNLCYFKPGKLGIEGHFDLVSLTDPVNNYLRLFNNGLRTIVNNLETAFGALQSLQKHIENVDPNDVYTVCQLNNNNGLSTRLVLSTFKGQANVYLRLYTSNEKGEVYPTRKMIKFDPEDDIVAMKNFVKGKK